MKNIFLVIFVILSVFAQSQSAKLKKGLELFSSARFEEAFPYLKPYADKGNSIAQYAVAYCYSNEKFSQKNDSLVEVYALKSANQKNGRGAGLLAIYYFGESKKDKSYLVQAYLWQKVSEAYSPLPSVMTTKGLILAYLEDAQIEQIKKEFPEFKKRFPKLNEKDFEEELKKMVGIMNSVNQVEEVKKEIFGIEKVETTGNAAKYIRFTEYQYIDGQFSQEGKIDRILGYDFEGRLVEDYDTCGLQFSFEYDSLGNQIKESAYKEINDKTGFRELTGVQEFEFNKQGIRVFTKRFVFENGTEVLKDTIREKLIMNDQGLLMEKHYILNGRFIDRRVYWLFPHEPDYKLQLPERKKLYSYENGELLMYDCATITVQSEFFNVLRSFDFKYDSNGNVVEKKEKAKSGEVKTSKYYYNPDGKIKNYEIYEGDSLKEKTEYLYNDSGLLIKETISDANGVTLKIRVYVY